MHNTLLFITTPAKQEIPQQKTKTSTKQLYVVHNTQTKSCKKQKIECKFFDKNKWGGRQDQVRPVRADEISPGGQHVPLKRPTFFSVSID